MTTRDTWMVSKICYPSGNGSPSTRTGDPEGGMISSLPSTTRLNSLYGITLSLFFLPTTHLGFPAVDHVGQLATSRLSFCSSVAASTAKPECKGIGPLPSVDERSPPYLSGQHSTARCAARAPAAAFGSNRNREPMIAVVGKAHALGINKHRDVMHSVTARISNAEQRLFVLPLPRRGHS